MSSKNTFGTKVLVLASQNFCHCTWKQIHVLASHRGDKTHFCCYKTNCLNGKTFAIMMQ